MSQTLSEQKYRELVTSQPDELAYDAASKMEKSNAGCVVVTSRSGGVVGIATRYDFVHNLIVGGKDPKKTKVREIMHASPITIGGDKTLTDALRMMIARRVRRLVVLSPSKMEILGVIYFEDIVSRLESASLATNDERSEKILEAVRRLTPALLNRYEGEEKETLRKDMSREADALLILLKEAEVILRS